MKIVWLSIHFPSFSRSGGDVASAKMLRAVAATGRPVYSVHIDHAPRDDADVEAFRAKFGLAGVRFVTTARRGFVEAWLLRFFLVALLPFLPVSYSRLMWPAVRRRYRAVLSDIAHASPQTPLLVICDGLQSCALVRGEGLDPGIRYVYRAHNVERDLWRSVSRLRGPLARAFMGYQSRRIASLERWVLRRFEQVHAISAENQAVLQGLCDEPAKVHLTPVALESPVAPAQLRQARRAAHAGEGAAALRLVFLGKLDWAPNRDGIAWFLDHVWSALLKARPDARLTIVGMGEEPLKARYAHLPRLRFTGYASDADLRGILLSHDLLVVPIFSGSGVRVKVLEAALHGLASIGTALGMSGSSLEPEVEFIPADGAAQWIETLARIGGAECEAFGARAFARVHGRFSREIVDRAAADALLSLDRPR
jgi:glycosyltransferase involved in cell wall biosynthesis